MAHLHLLDSDSDTNQITALYYAKLFTLDVVGFRFQSNCQLREWD